MNGKIVWCACLFSCSFAIADDGSPANNAAAKPRGAARVRMPRPFETTYDASFGIRITSRGASRSGFSAITVLPIEWPEQKLELLADRSFGGTAKVERLGDGASVLTFRTPPLAAGETAYVIRDYRITVKTIDRDWKPTDFPAQHPPFDRALKAYLGSTPGIQAHDATIVQLAKELTAEKETDLEKLEAIFEWVHREIEYKMMKFTSAKTAIINRIGDCEEKSAAFIALARAAGIPARTVWTPGHAWAEFHLVDQHGEGRWLPVETTNPPWFGCRGVATVVLQKGDNYRPPGWKGPAKRYVSSSITGSRPEPKVEFIQEIKPAKDAPAAKRTH